MVMIDSDYYHKVLNLKRVIELISDNTFSDDKYFVEFIMNLGVQRFFSDVFGNIEDGEVLEKTITQMFLEKPEFVANFIFNKIEEGKEIDEENKIKLKERWSYIR